MCHSRLSGLVVLYASALTACAAAQRDTRSSSRVPSPSIEPAVAALPAYPRRLSAAEIAVHLKAHPVVQASGQETSFILTIQGDGSIRRDCQQCEIVQGTGTLEVRQASDELCFSWLGVSYPPSGCFR